MEWAQLKGLVARRDGSIPRLIAAARRQAQAPSSQRGVFSSWSENMVPILDQQ
jgi:hypothetical protein